MTLSDKGQETLSQIKAGAARLGDIKALAKEIKLDHPLALELWATEQLQSRLLAILILDKKLLDQALIDEMVTGLAICELTERNQLSEWLLANQLMKSKKTITLLTSWQHHTSATLRRLFWYHQARLRWTGQTPPDNTQDLFDCIEHDLAKEDPEVQWAMNFCAAQIGIHMKPYRDKCITLGEKLGLYEDEVVAKNCTPSYLPEFIRIEAAKFEARG